MKHIELTSKSAEQTIEIAKKISRNLKGGEFIELLADVGGGKTTFVRGLASGAGSKSHVSSPTFTISKLYKSPEFDIMHFDFYRLSEAGLVAQEAEEAILDDKIVVVVEWSEAIEHVLPDERLIIRIEYQENDNRLLKLKLPNDLSYLINGLS